jgi:hypothetical protein
MNKKQLKYSIFEKQIEINNFLVLINNKLN